MQMKNRKQRKRTTSRRPRQQSPTLFERIQPDAAGIDCGKEHHFVAVPRERDPQPVRQFATFTGDLQRLAQWLVSCKIKTVAMESTGVYWIPVYEILEAHGLEVVLVNARHVRNVRGRKSDVLDCEWLQQLHSVGLLRASFRPAAEIVPLRAYVRHRATLVQSLATDVQRMQKALTQMNIMLDSVIADLTGATGLKIVGSIVAGQRDPAALAAYRDPRCQASREQIIAALSGNYREEHLFALRQNFAAYQFHLQQIAQCDAAIEALLNTLAEQQPQPTAALPPPRRATHPKGHEPRFDIRSPLHRLTGGADLSQIDAIGPQAALQLVAEIGTDMSRWPSSSHFTSWMTLAPNNKVSGGRLLSSKTPASANRAAAILRRCAMSLARTPTALGAFYRRLAARAGKAKAITATARKLALLVYRAMSGGLVYKDPGADAYHQLNRTRELKNLRKRARLLGLELIDPSTGQLMSNAVS